MFNLNKANKGIRKAAASKGIKTGKFNSVRGPGDVVAIVYDRNHPNGITIRKSDIEQALTRSKQEK